MTMNAMNDTGRFSLLVPLSLSIVDCVPAEDGEIEKSSDDECGKWTEEAEIGRNRKVKCALRPYFVQRQRTDVRIELHCAFTNTSGGVGPSLSVSPPLNGEAMPFPLSHKYPQQTRAHL